MKTAYSEVEEVDRCFRDICSHCFMEVEIIATESHCFSEEKTCRLPDSGRQPPSTVSPLRWGAQVAAAAPCSARRGWWHRRNPFVGDPHDPHWGFLGGSSELEVYIYMETYAFIHKGQGAERVSRGSLGDICVDSFNRHRSLVKTCWDSRKRFSSHQGLLSARYDCHHWISRAAR